MIFNISDTSYTFNDLTTNAYYDFYVRAKCSLSQSEWVGPYSFMIGLACPNDDVVLTSQTEVNDFVANYPSCTEISGNLIILLIVDERSRHCVAIYFSRFVIYVSP